MARSVDQGFTDFLVKLTPTQAQREAAATHRSSVEASLTNALGAKVFRETGSFRHGTGVRNHCDVDLLVSVPSKPNTSDTALSWVKTALQNSFPHTTVRISRPAVVVEFASGAETWEIIPGFYKKEVGADSLYDIPGPAGGWIESSPEAHLAYVTEINTKDGINGGAKSLTRLVKAWKYYCNVPISSFYLEMRAAKYMSTEASYVAVIDLCRLLESLHSHELANMNDPRGVTGQFAACSSTYSRTDALSKLKTAATRARKALDAHTGSDDVTAFSYLDLLFGGNFPAR